MYVVNSSEMRKMDQYTIEDIGIPELVLMENAGRALAEEVICFNNDHLRRGSGGRWIILVGKGNNGGDGLAAARHLYESGLDILIVYAVSPSKLTGSAAVQRDIIEKWKLPSMQYLELP